MPLISLPNQANFVASRGDPVLWRRAYKCPCTIRGDADGNRASVNCKVCDGLGNTYATPVAMTGILVNCSFRKDLLETGLVEPGDYLLSLSPFERNFVSDFDVINLTNRQGESYDGDTIQRLETGPDLLSFALVVFFKCFSIDLSNDDAITEYLPGVDFTVSGRQLTWLTNRGPDVGTNYEIKYTARFDWEAYVTPMTRIERGNSLGQRVLLRKRTLAVPVYSGVIATRPIS